MCGICGELRLDGRTPDTAVIDRMRAALAARGPDDAGTAADGPLAMGHQRLAIIDLSAHAHQPMRDGRTGNLLVFNGTIYNYRELHAELEALGHAFDSSGDTEVILRAWAEWGEDCVTRLHGMFAFALWHARERQLFLVRDRLGIKPLYYSLTPTHLRFASMPQALLAAGGVDTDIDPVALHHHMTLHAVVPAPRTILKGVRKLAPATVMRIDAGGETRQRVYWQLEATRPSVAKDEAEWQSEIRHALSAAIERRRLAADVPVGILLSGGLDSSLLVGLLADGGAEHIKTFSVGFEDMPEEAGSEFFYSDQVVERFATEHEKIVIPNTHIIDRLPEAIRAMAEPMVAQDAVAFFLLAEQVRKYVKVVQSGQGADEVFAGYFWYPQMQAAKGASLERFAPYYFDRTHAEFLQTVTDGYAGADHTSELVAELLGLEGADTYIDRVLRMDVTTLVVDDPVKRVDNMTMAWGLEARVPFLDHELVELAASMPPELKLGSGGKHVLKNIARGLLPDDVIDRPKGYFPVPALKYIRGEFLDLVRATLDSPACRRRGLLRRSYINGLLATPDAHLTPIRGSKLWHLALLELWLQHVVDPAASG